MITSEFPRNEMQRAATASRAQPVHGARERDRFADVMDSADPADGALQAESESGVYEGAVFPEIEVPVVRLDGESFFLDARQQLVVIVLALRAADNLAIAFRRQQIVAEHCPRISRILLHVKGLRLLRVVVDEDRTVGAFDEERFVLGAEIVAPFGGAALRLENLYRVAVVDARERRLDGLQPGDVALQLLELGLFAIENARDDV